MPVGAVSTRLCQLALSLLSIIQRYRRSRQPISPLYIHTYLGTHCLTCTSEKGLQWLTWPWAKPKAGRGTGLNFAAQPPSRIPKPFPDERTVAIRPVAVVNHSCCCGTHTFKPTHPPRPPRPLPFWSFLQLLTNLCKTAISLPAFLSATCLAASAQLACDSV